jgi:hypothetical protein
VREKKIKKEEDNFDFLQITNHQQQPISNQNQNHHHPNPITRSIGKKKHHMKKNPFTAIRKPSFHSQTENSNSSINHHQQPKHPV